MNKSVGVTLCLFAFNLSAYSFDKSPTTKSRTKLTHPEMVNGADSGNAPIDNRFFMPMGRVEPAKHTFSGSLVIAETTMRTLPRDSEKSWSRWERSSPRSWSIFSLNRLATGSWTRRGDPNRLPMRLGDSGI